jgi:hypothetical protein
MSPDCLRKAVASVKDFPYDSEPCPPGLETTGRRKTVWLIGGEPLLHPEFPELVGIMIEAIPDVQHRGLGTSLDWQTGSHPKWGPYRTQVERLVGPNPTHNARRDPGRGYLNWNPHSEAQAVEHQPILVASADAVPDERERWELIEQCWLQHIWSSGLTPKGFFFCEVAGQFDTIFDGPGGLPFEPGVWKGDLWFERDENGVPRPKGKFAEQIERWCPRCGACLPLAGRRDAESRDDISPMNLEALRALGSPRVRKGDFVPFDPKTLADKPRRWLPMRYVKGKLNGFSG